MSDRYAVQTLAEMSRFHARERGDRTALCFRDRPTTFAELDRAASRVANALIALGVTPGTRCATVTRDSDHVAELQLGIAKARGVIQGINWRLAPPEIATIVADGAAEVLFVGEESFAAVEAVLADMPSVRHVITTSGAHPRWPSYVELRDEAGGRGDADPLLPADPEEVVVQMHTSGTTGRPKGVMLPNRAFFAVIRSMHAAGDAWIGFTERDVSLQCFPLFHIGGFWWWVTGLHAGAANVIQDAFVAHQALALIERHRVTKTCLVPAMLGMMLAEPACRTTDLSTLTHVVYGGSPIPTPLLQESIRTFGCDFGQIYGLTETGNTAVFLRERDHDDLESKRLQAAGRPYPGVRVKVIGEDGADLPPRAIGEICIHSPANMVGYWNRPDATAETLRDGWVHTGDAGYLDEDGYVFVCDRVKDMILYAGENVYPAEVESALMAHPAILECAVIGVPHERWGEEVKALVVLKDGASAKPHEILAAARGKIAPFKIPKTVEFLAALPRTPSGKVQKAKLRAPYWEGRERQVN
jgi:acyl-CoA synthetase (AMP-forming)/AMP-acid ligase II